MRKQLSDRLFTTKTMTIYAVLAVVVGMFNAVGKLEAQSISDLRSETEQLQDDIKENQAAADKKHKHADNLEDAIGELDGEISEATSQINSTAGRIDELSVALIQKQKELVHAKELLKLNMQALYKRGDASTVELLVGSESFSAYIDEQEYLERIKIGIQEAADKVIKIKKQIKSQKEQKEEELAKQEAAKSSLDNLRGQRADLLEKTRGEEAEFKKVVKDLEEKRAAVDAQITNLVLEAARKAAANSGGGGGGGQVVSGNGQVIGRVGCTGYCFGAHLHFEMLTSSGQRVNPTSLMGAWPVSGPVTQGYGCVAPYHYYVTKCGGNKSFHPGIDIGAPYGAPIVATKPGKIIFKGWDGAYGNKVVIQHNDGSFSWYGHLSSF